MEEKSNRLGRIFLIKDIVIERFKGEDKKILEALTF